jgi:hypothetical protein
MNLEFDLKRVRVIEFGIGRDNSNGRTFVGLSVDGEVQDALHEMVSATWSALGELPERPERYEPSEKHGSVEYLYLPLSEVFASSMRELHEASNLPLDNRALDDLSSVFCYFARLTDGQGRRLTALQRATQFKGIVKSRLIRLATDALKLVADRVFKLDNDFDLLIDAQTVHILRPSGFEFAGKLQQAILEAVPENVEAIQKDLPFVDFADLSAYAAEHTRAARLLASIRGQAENINKAALKRLCRITRVKISESKGRISVARGHEIGFLEVLDRRRYRLELVKGQPETFRAPSRKKIAG